MSPCHSMNYIPTVDVSIKVSLKKLETSFFVDNTILII